MAAKWKTTKQQSTNNWAECNDGNGQQQQCERDRGGNFVSAGDSTTPAGNCDDDVKVAFFVGSVGGGFGGGDRQTALFLNNNNVVFDIGDN